MLYILRLLLKAEIQSYNYTVDYYYKGMTASPASANIT
jgi:hypothetical protein